MSQHDRKGIKKYIEVDLKRYIDPDTVRELQNAYYSQKASKYMQAIFRDLINRVKEKEEEIEELQEQVEDLESALKRQHRHVIKANESMENPERI